jgi:hypothetical protein
MISNNNYQLISYLLAVLMLLALLNSAFFFLSIAKFGVIDWLAFNACSVSIIVYLICFTSFQFTKKSFFLAIALVPLYYYGTMGLFVMPWNVANFFSQVTHCIITLNIIWVLSVLFKESTFESLGKGLLIGMFVFVPVFAIIQHYTQLHAAEFTQLLQKIK